MEHDIFLISYWFFEWNFEWNFDPCNVFSATARNIPQRLKTGFVLQGHKFDEEKLKFEEIWKFEEKLIYILDGLKVSQFHQIFIFGWTVPSKSKYS